MGSATQYIVTSHMRLEQRYTVAALYAIYCEKMNNDYFVQHGRISEDTLRKNLSAWSSVEGGILKKEMSGKYVVYYLALPECPYNALKMRAIELLRVGKSWLK